MTLGHVTVDSDTQRPEIIASSLYRGLFKIIGQVGNAVDTIFYQGHYLIDIFIRLNFQTYPGKVPVGVRAYFFDPLQAL